jgi:hypothetical protein
VEQQASVLLVAYIAECTGELFLICSCCRNREQGLQSMAAGRQRLADFLGYLIPPLDEAFAARTGTHCRS